MLSGIVLGFVAGLTTGMLAVGLVLVYKASRFINLAHGQLGALSSVLLATLVLNHGLSWWVAFPASLAVGIGVGVLVDRFIIRPLRNSRRRGVTMLLVTLGVGQLLTAITFIPGFIPDRTRLLREGYPVPFTVRFEVGGAVLLASHLMILVLVPATVGAVAAFLRFTSLGKSVRAAAANPDAARLCGVSVDRVNMITWGIAGALSGVTAILLSPSQSVFDASSFGPGLLLRALGAAALGGFVSIPAAMVGGILLGVIEQVALATTSNGTTAEVTVFIAVLLILFLRGRRISSAAFDASDLVEDRSVTRVPADIADRFVVRRHRLLLGGAGTAFALVLPNLPYFSRTEHQFLLVILVVYATVGVGLTMLLGWAGQVSLGHFAVLGVGAYVAAQLGRHDLSLPVVCLVAGLVGAFVMTLVGLPALRLRGLTLAVTTLGFAVAGPTWLYSQPWFDSTGRTILAIPPLGVAGLGRVDTQLSIYYVALALLILTALSAGALRRSVPGRFMLAARDNDAALATFGVTPATVKLSMLAVSGFIAGAAGVVWGLAWSNVSPDLLSPSQSLALLVIPVVGGLGSISGAIGATAVIYLTTYFIGPALTPFLGDFGNSLGFQLALAGAGLVFVPLTYPAGLAGAAQQGWERFLRGVHADVERWAPAPSSNRLEVRDVAVSFGGVHALGGVDIDVRAGEIVGLIGPNGAGKTTLINVISGQRAPDAGTVRIDGHDITDLAPEVRNGFGLSRNYQDARLFPGLTVTEAIQVALGQRVRVGVLSSMLGAPWARGADRQSRQEADRIIATMGLTEWADALTSELSTGLRRITDLAMQVAARPTVLLLDEPTGGVAQREAEAFGPMLRQLRDELDCCILIVEHDMPLLMGLCDRVYAMETGQVIAVGSPEEIRNDPAVVASYLGTDATAIERPNGRTTPAADGSAKADGGRVGSRPVGRPARVLRVERT